MPLGEPDPGQVPLDGLSDPLNYLPDHLHLNSAPPLQRLVHSSLLPSQTGPLHDHTDDGRHLPGLFSLLRLYQY